ncbi:hypothetical protein EDB85DRAFT_1896315 [Lactarius pseudohatsudake]|nr:hypothetical protein EDB85DRAFT_1896315 [Lactarius pseudohatsudake]
MAANCHRHRRRKSPAIDNSKTMTTMTTTKTTTIATPTTATWTTRRLEHDGSEYEQLGLASGRLDDGSTLHARPIVVAPTATMVKRWQPEQWDDADDSLGSECCHATYLSWVTPGHGSLRPYPHPNPHETRTRAHRYGYRWIWVRVQMGKFAGWYHSTTVRLRQAASSSPPAVVASPRSTAVCPVVTVVVVAAVETVVATIIAVVQVVAVAAAVVSIAAAVVAIIAAVVAIITAVIVVIISIVVAGCSELRAASPSRCCWGAAAVVVLKKPAKPVIWVWVLNGYKS